MQNSGYYFLIGSYKISIERRKGVDMILFFQIKKVFLMVMIVGTMQVFSQTKELKITAPKPYDCIAFRHYQNIKWDVPDRVKGKVEIVISKGENKVVLVKKTAIETKECSVLINEKKILPGSDYYINIRSIDSASYLGSVGPLLVTQYYGEPEKLFTDLSLGWSPSITIDSEKIKFVKRDQLNKIGVAITSVEDTRKYKQLVGGLYEDDELVWRSVVLTKDTVATWFKAKLSDLLGDLGVSGSGNAGFNVQISILTFFVKEMDKYNAEIVARVAIFSSDGTKKWEGIIRGFAGDWGTTYIKSTYQKCIADSFLNFSISLLENLSLQIE